MISLTTATATSSLDGAAPAVAQHAPHTVPHQGSEVELDRVRRSWAAEVDGLVGAVIAAVIVGSVACRLIDAEASMPGRVAVKGGGHG